MLTSVKSDPLDILLFTIGLRLSQLAKTGDSKFKSLLENRNFTIQLGSEAEQIFRTYAINNGYFTQTADRQDNPSLTITFKDSMTGVKLLTKGDATAFMVGIQNGDLKMAGDYSLLMWFNQIAKFIVPKVPEQLQPIVEQAKPLLAKATPFAKDLFEKASSFFADKKMNTQTDTEQNNVVNSVKENSEQKTEKIVTTTEEKITNSSPASDDINSENNTQLDAQNLTTAESTTQELQDKHADDEVIAENVKTDAVKSDDSPITNITVTKSS